ncbi:putative sugar kinase [uncultured archaeon]|nr:putative sugar kinase [uncultured archaeon]
MIYVSGPISFDTMIYCPEFPEPNTAVPITELHESCGGAAGNVASCLSALGVRASVISLAGKDFPGSGYESRLKSLGVSLEHVKVEARELTSHAFMPVNSHGEIQSFFFQGATKNFDSLPVPKIRLGKKDLLHIATGSPGFNRRLSASFPKEKISFDPGYDIPLYSKSDLEYIFSRVGIISMNENELKASLEKTGKSAPEGLLDYGATALVVTFGKRGSKIFSGGKSLHVRAYDKAAPIDTTGAGDAYKAGFAAAYSRGMEIGECAKVGSATASFIIEHIGGQAGIPDWETALSRSKKL